MTVQQMYGSNKVTVNLQKSNSLQANWLVKLASTTVVKSPVIVGVGFQLP